MGKVRMADKHVIYVFVRYPCKRERCPHVLDKMKNTIYHKSFIFRKPPA